MKLHVPDETPIAEIANQVREHDLAEPTKDDLQLIRRVITLDKLVSTNCTLLDLAICGGRVRGGGLPGGIIVEIFGPSSTGKTAVAAEIAASVQKSKGEVLFRDPEARFDKEYSIVYGVDIRETFFNYTRPDTVSQLFEDLFTWEVKDTNVINCFAADSLAALSTNLELDAGDKMGMRRAKEFSEGLRKTCRKIANTKTLMICTNQIRQGDMGYTTPGGMGLPFYCSVRISLRPAKVPKLSKKKKMKLMGSEKDVEIERVFGISSEATIVKNSIDDPYRTAPINIVFGYGVDDIRGNLQWIKDMTKATTYFAIDRHYQGMDDAIRHVEEGNLAEALRETVIDLWEEIDAHMRTKRKPKQRG